MTDGLDSFPDAFCNGNLTEKTVIITLLIECLVPGRSKHLTNIPQLRPTRNTNTHRKWRRIEARRPRPVLPNRVCATTRLRWGPRNRLTRQEMLSDGSEYRHGWGGRWRRGGRKELRGARETEGERGFSILLDPAKACPPVMRFPLVGACGCFFVLFWFWFRFLCNHCQIVLTLTLHHKSLHANPPS